MKNIERFSVRENEGSFEALDNKKKFEIVLELFGAQSAREAFIDKCRRYARLRSKNLIEGENYSQHRTYSPPQRANVHNQIMATLQRLSLQKLSPLSEKVLNEMADREVTGQIIQDWVAANEEVQEEDEGEERRKGMSDTAYFHSLGKGG